MEAGDINASISVDDTVTFVDSTPHFTKVDVDSALLLAQEQSKRLYDLERQLNSSKEYLAKVRLVEFVRQLVDELILVCDTGFEAQG